MKKDIPICSSSFEKIRTCNGLYVDKTEYIYELVRHSLNKYYTLFRPRGFGKSLMCSTLQALFEGKRELFRGLYIDSTDYSFEKYPVLRFNLGCISTASSEAFRKSLQNRIIEEAGRNGISVERAAPSTMLIEVLEKAVRKVVIIIDEYDTPIINTAENRELSENILSTLRPFYSVIKNACGNIRFVYITGITKEAGIFERINNTTDISLNEDYAAAFGYTQEELETYFSEYIDEYMEREDREYGTSEEFLEAVRDYYYGWRFSGESGTRVYNPDDIGRFFASGCLFDPYWINTGSTTVAADFLRSRGLSRVICSTPVISGLDLALFDYPALVSEPKRYSASEVLYFTGYLTIKEGNGEFLHLTFPNAEVREQFSQAVVDEYTEMDGGVTASRIEKALRSGSIEDVVDRLNEYISRYRYDGLDEGERGIEEAFFTFFLMPGGIRTGIEDDIFHERTDVILKKGKEVFLFGMRFNASPEKILHEIRQYCSDDESKKEKHIHLAALSFSSEKRKITSWKEERTSGSVDLSRVKRRW